MEESIVHYTDCPVCGADKLRPALRAKDYTVSGKEFDIWECVSCTLRFTQDIPGPGLIGQYYQSPDYISHTDNSEGFTNRIYHFVRKMTLGEKRRLIMTLTGLKSGKLLDIGSGTGAFVKHMQMNGWQATGLEPDEATRQRAAALHKVSILPADDFYGLPSASFNVVTMWHVLEHVHDLHSYIEQLKEVLKPGGRIFIAVPNYTSYDASVYRGYWAAYDVPRHLYHFSPQSMKHLLASHGLQLHSMRSMRYDSFYISFLSEKYKKGNIIKGFFVALLSNIKAFVNKERCSSIIYIAGK